MKFHALFGAILATIGFVQASPFRNLGLVARDLSLPDPTCQAFVTGADQKNIGQVCLSISGNNLIVSYPPNQSGYTDAHVWVGLTKPDGTVPGSVPGQFPYTSDNKFCTISADKTAVTCTIPLKPEWRDCSKKIYIVVHASVGGQTGWGSGTCYDKKGNCAKFFTFNTQCLCGVVYTYAPITASTECTYSSVSSTPIATVIDYSTSIYGTDTSTLWTTSSTATNEIVEWSTSSWATATVTYWTTSSTATNTITEWSTSSWATDTITYWTTSTTATNTRTEYSSTTVPWVDTQYSTVTFAPSSTTSTCAKLSNGFSTVPGSTATEITVTCTSAAPMV